MSGWKVKKEWFAFLEATRDTVIWWILVEPGSHALQNQHRGTKIGLQAKKMKNKERLRLLRTYAMHYKRADVDLAICAYCSFPRQCLDHVPPLAWIETFDIDKYKNRGGEFLLYPSCARCNGWLGHKELFTYSERLPYLYERYAKAVDKEATLWTKDEIDELGYSLQIMVKARQSLLKELMKAHRGVETNVINYGR